MPGCGDRGVIVEADEPILQRIGAFIYYGGCATVILELGNQQGHPMPRFSFAVLAAGFLACLFALGASAPGYAQDYPNRPITLVIPFPPGGSTSIVGRVVADKMSEILGMQIVVDN